MKTPFLLAVCTFLLIKIRAEDIWTSFKPGSGYGNRNEFVIKEAVSDESFVLGIDVYSWKSIKHGRYAYAVGLMPFGLTIIKAGVGEDKNRFLVNHTIYALNEKPVDIALHGCWNKTIRKTELILAVATINEIVWHKIHDDLTTVKFWNWSICKTIHKIEFYKQNRLHKLLMITQDEAKNTYADTYEFSLQEKQFWLTQTIPLANPTKSSAVSISGSNYYLSIPQKQLNLILIFKYSGDHFVSYKNISCKNADFVASFRVSFKTYLAVAGDDGRIFEFYKNTLRQIEVEGSNLQGVKFWFPIPVNNFREEVVLLLQKRVDFEPHDAWHLEAVLHNENKFTLLEEFHCKFHGEEMSGLRCMADEDRQNGIVGLTILSIGQTLGLLVPRADDAPSGLLMLQTGMKSLSSEVQEEVKKLDATKARLERLLDKHQKSGDASKTVGSSWFLKPSAMNLRRPEAAFQQDNIDWNALGLEEFDFQIKQLEIDTDALKMEIGDMQRQFNEYLDERQSNRFDTLIFNGTVKVEGNGTFGEVFANDINHQNLDNLLKNTARPDNIEKLISSKQFKNLKVQNLYFENVDGIPVENLMFSESNSLNLKGDVVFKSPVSVHSEMISTSGDVNGIILKKEVVTTQQAHDGQLNFEDLKVQSSAQINFINKMRLRTNYLENIPPVSDLTNLRALELDILYIPVDIQAEIVNGENFEDFLKTLVMKNLPTKIPGALIVDGDLNLDKISKINYLNDLRFPDDFLLTHSQLKFTKILGRKNFTNTITAKEIMSSFVNGINPKTFINLSKNQTIPATIHFENLEITERLIVDDDNIIDENLLSFQSSPTLEESKTINSNLNFQDLEIDGNLTIVQNFNGTNFNQLLNSVVYKDEAIVKINSVKEFPQGFSVTKTLDIKHNSINNIPLNSFIFKDTDELLQLTKLKGNVTFKNLHLTGLYNGINVTKLDEETVKTFGEQFISADLKFDQLNINKLFINKTLNEIPVEHFLFTDDEERVFEDSVEFESFVAKSVWVNGSLETPLKNFDIEEFDKKILSSVRDQLVPGNYTIVEAHVKNLSATEINGISVGDLFGRKRVTAEQLVQLAEGQNLKIKDLRVKGALQMTKVNGIPSENILGSNIWKNKPNMSLVIEKNARFGHLTTEIIDGVDFANFTSQLVFKNETSIRFPSDIVFENGFSADKIRAKNINGVPIEDLKKTTSQMASIKISGDLHINSDVVIETINGQPLQEIGKKVEIRDETLKLKGDVHFANLLETDELWINGKINGINVSDVFRHAVLLNRNAVFNGKMIFQQPVYVKDNFGVKETVDGINLAAFMEAVVLKTKNGVVPSKVVFLQPVVIKNSFDVVGNMYTEYLDGCDVAKWNENALFINQGLLKGKFAFDDVTINGNLYTTFVNNLDMTYIIPLRSEQQIFQKLDFGEISSYHDITVGNLVNGRNLRLEFKNTLLNDFSQIVESNIKFAEKVFVENVEATGKMNGLSLKNIVTTHTDQILVGSYNFSKGVSIKGNLQNSGTLNGINLNEWYGNSLKRFSKLPQTINGQLTVFGEVEFDGNVESNGRINGLELAEAVKELETKKAAKYLIEKDVMNDYNKVCLDVNRILRASKKQIHSFKYFESLQTETFPLPIQNIHHFAEENQNYLLVSEDNNCLSHLFVWNTEKFVFINSIETGLIAQVVTVTIKDLVFLVTRNPPTNAQCAVNGTNIWFFQRQTLKRLKLLKMSALLQNSRRPGTFYSLESEAVVEYRITEIGQKIRKYRKWNLDVPTRNLVFVPRGLNTGLALMDDNKMMKLLQSEPENWTTIKGTLVGAISKNFSTLPWNAKNELVVLLVGIPGKINRLFAVATREKSSIEKGLDLIKIYEDLASKRLFQNIPAYKPSSLTSIEFENGETLLAFLEDESVLQLYEYKGIEGFKRRASVKFPGSKLFVVYLGNGENKRTILGIINQNKISLLDGVMMGNKLETAEIDCDL